MHELEMNTAFKLVTNATQKMLADCWDKLCILPLQQILNGGDATYRKTMLSMMTILATAVGRESLVDLGCGVSQFTHVTAKIFSRVVGVDASPASIEIANRNFGNSAEFVCSTIEGFANASMDSFQVAVTSMVLYDAIDPKEVNHSAYIMLKIVGALSILFCIQLFGQVTTGMLIGNGLNIEMRSVLPRATRLGDNTIDSIHFYRSLSTYLNLTSNAGFRILETHEFGLHKRNSSGNSLGFEQPKFLAVVARRV